MGAVAFRKTEKAMAKKRQLEPLETPLAHNADAERSVLGGILLENRALDYAVELLEEKDFFVEAHRVIFRAMLGFRRAEELKAGKDACLGIDLVTLTEALARKGELDAAGGPAYLAQMVDGIPRVGNIRHYAMILREKTALRELARASNEITEASLSGFDGSEEILERAQEALSKIAEGMERGAENSGAVTASDAVADAMKTFETLREGRGLLGVPTGYKWLDVTLCGWQDFILLAGRPSKGKTALLLECIARLCTAGIPSLLFSLEMDKRSLLIRLACLVARVDSHKLRSGYASKEEWGRILAALEAITKWPLWIDDRAALRSTEIRRRTLALARLHRIKFVAVDYIQIVRPPRDVPDMRERVTQVSLDFQAIAKDLKAITGGAFMALCQLSRQADGRRPRLSDLAESGQLERDADTVLFAYDEKGDESDVDRACDPSATITKVVEVAKQRNGPVDLRRFLFFPPFGGFSEKTADGMDVEPPPYLGSARSDEAWLTQ